MAVALGAALGGTSARADDRALLREGEANPYVFILLDISGSMNQSIPCSPESQAAGFCEVVCAPGACVPRLSGDDPDSRIFQSKQAIFDIMEKTDNIHFGFSTFDLDNFRGLFKHWWYRVAPVATPSSDLITLQSGRIFPEVGTEFVFGADAWPCTEFRTRLSNGNVVTVSPENNIGCGGTTPAQITDVWEYERFRRYPKLGDANNRTVRLFLRDSDNERYRVSFIPITGNTLGNDQVTARVLVERCTNSDCSSRTTQGDRNITFDKAGEFLYWETQTTDRDNPQNPPEQGFFGGFGNTRDVGGGTTNGMEVNTDSGDDDWNGENVMLATITDPFDSEFQTQFGRSRGAAYTVGDLIPLDWKTDQRQTIQRRMAANFNLGETVPRFDVVSYFNDHPSGTGPILRLRDTRARPLPAQGGTPTGASMRGFQDHLEDWLAVALDDEIGDPDLPCRSINLIVITDGLASDGEDACDAATALRTLRVNVGGNNVSVPVRSFAIAMGNLALTVPQRDNVLNCIADNGGTGATDHNGDGEPDGLGPFFPQNRDELVEAINQIFSQILTRNRSFAAAAVPQAQANTADKIFLTNFIPVPDEAIWAGRIDAYRRPIPLTSRIVTLPNGTTETRFVPDRDKVCGPSDESECRLWDAGEELLVQAPDSTQLAADDFNLGNAEDERRAYYATIRTAATPETRNFLEIPTTDAQWQDLLVGFGICDLADPQLATCVADTDNRDEARGVLRYVAGVKTFTDDDDNVVPYVLGDIFHSNPQVIGRPDVLPFFINDLFSNGNTCDDTSNPNPGYRCFFEKHQFRRNVLVVGANDGQVHAFDAGIFRRDGATLPVRGEFDDGTGRELFSYMPRLIMPGLQNIAEPNAQQRFTVDGTIAVSDVFIDPDWVVNPVPTEREWRTVAVGGLREGGSGYYALDITQPDTIDNDFVPQPRSGTDNFVPSCSDGGTGCGPVSYPAVLWEFADAQGCSATVNGQCDDDLNGLPDLGTTWSEAVLGLIRVCTSSPCDTGPSGNVVERFVAIFGGGLDPDRKQAAEQRGNFLYMVDLETGRALYKRELDGAVPASPALVAGPDGIFDTLYIGTDNGTLYKVDLRDPVPLENMPGIGERINDTAWDPFAIFTSGDRPFYFTPTVIFLASRGENAIAIGTGDREDLWEQSATDDGRFYLFVDQNLTSSSIGLPIDEGDLRQIDINAPGVDPGTDFLLNPTSNVPGWFVVLANDERVISQAFALGGVTVFNTFTGEIDRRTLGNNSVVCANRGSSRTYVLFTTNGNGVLASGNRFRVVPDLVTEPFTEVGAIKNPDTGEGGPTSDDITDDLRAIQEALQQVAPENCRFANYTINIKALRSDTGVEFLAPIPICITQRNWKEF